MKFNKCQVAKNYRIGLLLILLLGYSKENNASFDIILYTAERIVSLSLGATCIYAILKSVNALPDPITCVKNVSERFDEVAGAQEAKADLKDIIDYLKDPKKYTRLGASVPKGVLLQGEPGNGKTLLARAVAGEANCAFYSINGSEFINMYVGVGASKVRELFKQARKNAPAIIFIDEIDAIGVSRGSHGGGGGLEYSQTLNQLLTCMDGFEKNNKPIIVIAATNRAEMLDKALLRPGRFDRIVNVPYPDLQSRIEILELYIKKHNIDPTINSVKIAQGTFGFSGADLANLVNEAVLFATKKDKEIVEMADFEDARDKIIMGSTSKTIVMTENDRKVTAYHEAGHALINLELAADLDPLHKVTITPRGTSLGATYSLPEREKYNQTKNEMLAIITMCCGGRAAEELVFDKITTGAQSDFVTASKLARQIVCDYGMSEDVGMVIYMSSKDGYSCSQKTVEQIDLAVNKIVSNCYGQAKKIISANRYKLDALASALLIKETLSADEVQQLLKDVNANKQNIIIPYIKMVANTACFGYAF